MYTISKLEHGVVLPPIARLVRERPASWQGMSLEWAAQGEPVPVFLRQFSLEDRSEVVFLFGARYNTAHVLVDGNSLGSGHFVEYFVVVPDPARGDWRVHRLLQRNSVTYSESDDEGDYQAARTISNPQALSLRIPPQWKESEALWPTHAGKPMRFVGQYAVPENKISRALFTWDVVIYVFWARERAGDCFKIMEQRPHEQTAEEFHALTDD